jgi:hypothetical protein
VLVTPFPLFRSDRSSRDPHKCSLCRALEAVAAHLKIIPIMPLLSWIASGLDKWLPSRQGRAQCSCGAIQIDLHVPGSSYGLIDQSTGLCHCKDCVGFLKALGAQGEAFLRNNES